ncbi:uncharacterized protein LOC144441451 [Glandiceps talaboti]
MAKFMCIITLLVVVVTVVQACSSSTGRTPAMDIGKNAEIYPTFDPNTKAVGVGVTIRFKRGAAAMPRDAVPDKDQVFGQLDINNDNLVDVDEWLRHHGTVKNFAELLRDDDTNGDEKISLDEFKNLKLYYKTPQQGK